MPAPWIPILPSALLDPAQVLKIKVFDQELAVWRSASGRVQIWENRCPHRSVRLSIGKVVGESLICAYHGWAFDAQSSRCQRIPAQPQQRAPQSLCAKAYTAAETQAMIWFAGFTAQAIQVTPLAESSARHYAGSVISHCSQQAVQQLLLSMDFIALTPYVWHGNVQDLALNIYLTPSHAEKQQLHLLCQHPARCHLAAEILLQLRDHLEQTIDAAC